VAAASGSGDPRNSPEEAALGQQLMAQDLEDRAGTGMWTEGEVIGSESGPNRRHFVRFPRVGFERVPEQWISCGGNLRLGNGDVSIDHGCLIESCVWSLECKWDDMIRKLKSGEYRLYSKKKDARGKRKNLGTFDTREAAEKHERAVQYFKRAG
jgi:hypothetical protein